MTGAVEVLLLTDLEGSTRLWAEHAEVMVAVMAEHRSVLRSAIEAHGGRLPVDQGEGDAVFAAFRSATDAVAAVLRFQGQIESRSWPEGIVLRDRVGIHAGEVVERDGNLFGIAISRAARIRSLAAGGQILLSSAVIDLLEGRLPDGVGTTDLGLHRLKDLTHPERVHQLDRPGTRAVFPPLASLDRLPNNLPVERWPLVGRDADVRDLAALVQDERLVTVVGFGGMGKTRLALQVAAELLDGSGDGVWFVDLAAVEDAARIPATVLAAVGVEEGTLSPTEALLAWARARTVLLVLDNLEQLLPAAADLVGELLDAGRGVHLLVTSREPIRIAGERVFALEPLAVAASVRLLVDRATSARRDFALTPETEPVVEAICARLDGSPLAIELAAARLRVLSPEALLARLDRALPMLTGGARSLPARQQTVRATIEWSTRSLDPGAADLLDALSVFPGSFDLEAAEAVHARPEVVLDGMTELVDRSLLQPVAEDGTRSRLLVPVREFAAERLAASGAEDAVRDRHAAWFTSLVRLPPDWTERDQRRADGVVRSDWHNVRQALDRLHSTGRTDDEIALAPWLSIGLLLSGMEGEGLRVLLHTVEDLDPQVSTIAGALLWSLLSRYQDLTYRNEDARRSLPRVVELVDAAGDDALRIYLATLNTRQGDPLRRDPASIRQAGELLRALPATGNAVPRWFLERIWSNEVIKGRLLDEEETTETTTRLLAGAADDRARTRLEYEFGNSLVAAARLGAARAMLAVFEDEAHLRLLPPLLRPNALSLLAELAIAAGRHAEARVQLDRTDALLQQMDAGENDAQVTVMRAAVDRAAGRSDVAFARLGAFLGRDSPDARGVSGAYAHWLRAVIAREDGDHAGAVHSLRIAWRIGERVMELDVTRVCLLERSVQCIDVDPAAAAPWLTMVVALGHVPAMQLAVDYDLDGLLARLPADVGAAASTGSLVLPPW